MPGKRGAPQGPRPHTWVTGPDPVRHAQYDAWLKSRAQANYRGEVWELEFKDWVAAWGDQWHRRGRTKDTLQLMRDNAQLPWRKDNIVLVDRAEFYRRQGLRKRELHQQRKALTNE